MFVVVLLVVVVVVVVVVSTYLRSKVFRLIDSIRSGGWYVLLSVCNLFEFYSQNHLSI